MAKRTVLIGDVHGCTNELNQLFEQIESYAAPHPTDLFFAFVGDLVDRGTDSAGAVRTVRTLMAEGRAACVLGNHEEMMLMAIGLARPDLCRDAGIDPAPFAAAAKHYGATVAEIVPHWLSQGGKATMASFGCGPDPRSWRVPSEDLQWLAGLPVLWEDSEVVLTHALATEAELALARRAGDAWRLAPGTRESLLWSRQMPRKAPDPQRFHVSGHTPMRECVIVPELRVVRIDTGCVYGNALSAVVLPEQAVFSEPSMKQAPRR